MHTRAAPAISLALALAFAAPVAGQAIDEAAVESALAERAAAQEAAIAARAAAQEAAKAAQQAMLDARAQEYVQLMQPLLWRELEFVRQTCELTPQQRPKIKAAAEKGVQQAARGMVAPQHNPGGSRAFVAHQTIRNDVVKALTETLTSEQLERYQAEATRRSATYKHAAIENAVAQLDCVLFFSEEQRRKIADALDKNWQDDWEQWMHMWRYSGQYYPLIPDQHLTPHLSPEQKSVWSGLQKLNYNAWTSPAARDAADDEWWDGKSSEPPATQTTHRKRQPQ